MSFSFFPHGWFLNPALLWLLAGLPLLALLLLWAWRQRRRALLLLGFRAALFAHRTTWRRILRGWCLALALILLVVGAAGPQWGRDWTVEVVTGRDLVVVLDQSRSMLAELPTRQERARRGLDDLARLLERRGGYRIGLVVFAARAVIVCPLTHDAQLFRHFVGEQDANRPLPGTRPAGDLAPSSTRIGLGLIKALEVFEEQLPEGKGKLRGARDIILVSDGDDPAGDNEWIDGAEVCREKGVPVHVVGVGDPLAPGKIPGPNGPLRFKDNVITTMLYEEPLREIARRTQGVYIPAQTKQLPLGQLFAEVIEPRPLPRQEDTPFALVQRYPWFLAPALGLLAAALLLGEVAGKRKTR